jgi:hypothetical protein
LEATVPRWFRAEVEGPQVQPHYRYLAWAGAVLVALLLNLSGKAVREEGRVLYCRVFGSLSVCFVMVLFMHVIAARGAKFTISVAFRTMYLIGIVLAPVAIVWRRWRFQSQLPSVPL